LNAANTTPHPKPVNVDRTISFTSLPLLYYSVNHTDLQFYFL
jgi:hypothetical protein